MSIWLLAIIAYLGFAGLFVVAWSRGLPAPENGSRAIKRFEQRRRLRRILSQAYRLDHASDWRFASLLKKLQRIG